MTKDTKNNFKNATGKIDYTLMNDYMFHRIMEENESVLKELVCALLHLQSKEVYSITVMNPIEQGTAADAKTYNLDLKILLNSNVIINIELQVESLTYLDDRSSAYFVRTIDALKKGDTYASLKPVFHIGILNFTPFPDYPEFFAANKLMNVKKHYVYNDKFTLNVLDLTQIDLATDEDKQWKLDEWARLFKAKTWEELRMIAHKSDIFDTACESIFELNQDDVARMWAEAREEGLRRARTDKILHEHELAKKDKIIAKKNDALAKKDSTIAEKDNALAEKDSTIAQMYAEIQRLKKQVQDKAL